MCLLLRACIPYSTLGTFVLRAALPSCIFYVLMWNKTKVYFQGFLHMALRMHLEHLFLVLLLRFFLVSIQRTAVWKGQEVGVQHYYLIEKQLSVSHLEMWSFPSVSHSGNRRHIDPMWTCSQQSCLCPHVSSGPWCKPCRSQENWLVLVSGSYIWLVRMNHGRTYCASSDQMSSGRLADTELGFPKGVLEVGRKAHSGKVCHLHEGLCVHASSLFPFFAMGMYSVGPSLPSPRRLLGLGWGACRWCLKFSPYCKSTCFLPTELYFT